MHLRSTWAIGFTLFFAVGCGGGSSQTGSATDSESVTSDATAGSTSASGTATNTAGTTTGSTGTGGTTGGDTANCLEDPAWTVQEIGLPGPRQLLADSLGEVHLLVSPNTGDLEHRRFDGQSFGSPEVILANPNGEHVFAADSAGNLHGVVPASGGQTAYLTHDGALAQWMVVMDEGSHTGSDMVVDDGGNLHLVLGLSTYVKRPTDGAWLPVFNFPAGEGYVGVTMMNGAPLVCFSNAQGYKECALANPDGTFPDPVAISEFANYMAMDGPGNRAFLYLNRIHNGTTWEAGLTVLEGVEPVETHLVETGQGIGIGHMLGATGPGERPHAGYVLFVNGASGDLGLRHATLTDGQWQHSWAACGLDTSRPSITANAERVFVAYHKIVEGVGTRLFVASRSL